MTFTHSKWLPAKTFVEKFAQVVKKRGTNGSVICCDKLEFYHIFAQLVLKEY